MKHRLDRTLRTAVLAAATLAACAFASHPASADSRIRLTPIHKQSGELPVSGPEHVLYGKIVGLARPYFTMQLRSGRVLNVNASDALESGHYSAPLFVGKTIVIQGKLDATGVVHAENVTRLTQLDRSTALDR